MIRDATGHPRATSTEDTLMPTVRDRQDAGTPFAMALLAAAGAAVIGTFAQDMAKWAVCVHSAIVNQKACGPIAKAEALNIGTMLATMAAVGGAAAAASRGQVSDRAAVSTIFAALVGAFFALLKATAEGADYPRPELLPVPIYLYAVCVFLFALPLVCLPRDRGGYGSALALLQRLAAAIGIGFVLGWCSQLAAELIWNGIAKPPSGAQKFIVPPSTTATAAGAWGVALLGVPP